MAEGNSSSLFAGISLSTIVQVGTLGAAIVAQWALMSSQVSEIRTQLAVVQKDLDRAESSIVAVATRTSVLEIRYENLREVINELRRQSNLRAPPG